MNRTDCRSQIDAQVINVKCASAGSLRDQVSPPPSCVLELRVDNQTRFLDLPSAGIANRPAPARLQVEMFRGLPTAAVLDGKLVRRYGSPDRAVQTMKNMGWLWLGIWLLCSVYLWRRNRALRLGAATSA